MRKVSDSVMQEQELYERELTRRMKEAGLYIEDVSCLRECCSGESPDNLIEKGSE